MGHCYRCGTMVEPYISTQWFVRMKPLAERARKVAENKSIQFWPPRWETMYYHWIDTVPDWPISRQLWWGHQIPIWSSTKEIKSDEIDGIEIQQKENDEGRTVYYVCVCPDNIEAEKALEAMGFERDEDVLDTWFSSALWPFSTLGWPEDVPEMDTFYPGDLLCTAREIITLWVSRMVMMGQYCVGDIPFRDVYIHAMIQDGKGRKMSKSLGNGIDPLIAIDSHGADAMRFTLANMTTDTQDVRMPVAPMELPDGRTVNTSPKFDIGRNFCNKLWNAGRFAMMNLEGLEPEKFDASRMTIADTWILSRLAATIKETTALLDEFKFNEPLNSVYKFFWNDLCDWYLEWAKPRMQDPEDKPTAQNVLAYVLDQTLRLLHPFIPFITEGMFQKLNELAPVRKLEGIAETGNADAIIVAEWPVALTDYINKKTESDIAMIQNAIRSIRDVRSQYNIAPKIRLKASAKASAAIADVLNTNSGLLCRLAGLEEFIAGQDMEKPSKAASAVIDEIQIFVHDVIDPDAEHKRLEKQKEQILKGLGATEGKLNNENFVSRAKPEVVEQARAKLKEFQDQLAAIEKHLAEIGD